MKTGISFFFAAALAAASLAATTFPASAAWPVVKATSGATIYARPSSNARTLGRVPRYTLVTIDYCTPPDADWCHIIWDGGPNGWVDGGNLGSPAKKALVTPFMSIFEPGWPENFM